MRTLRSTWAAVSAAFAGMLAVCLAMALCLGFSAKTGRASSGTGAPPDGSAPPATDASSALRPIGAASCSARACHGSLEPTGTLLLGRLVLRNEYTTWLERDPHARAYDVLSGDWAASIARNLSAGSGKILAAHEDVRCLACHATPTAARSTQAALLRREGVGCEACHGPAERWLAEHTSRSFEQLDPGDKRRGFAMTPTRDLPSRARLCAACHLGASAEEGLPARDVNHDLIAAGHPRMDFELTEFLARMPSHWVEKEGNRALPSAELAAFQARAWAVGQIATAQAALGLLAERAGKKDRPWPELAEYDCFACHHDLAEPSWRQARGYGARRPGSPPWGSWSFALLPRALSFPGVEGAAVGKANSGAQGDAAAQAMESLDRLRAAMSQPSPDRVRVADLARSADAPLSSALAKTAQAKVDFALLPSLAQAILADASTRALSSYDDARQAYLAASALQNALLRADPRPRHPEIAEALTQLAKRLALPDNFNSPRDFDSTTPAVSSDSSPARVNPPREVP